MSVASAQGFPSPSRTMRRREDPELIRGRRHYIGDITRPGLLHAAFVRSIVPHGIIESIDYTGDADFYTHDDLGLVLPALPMFDAVFSRPVLADGRVRHVGDPVAVVLADTRRGARDAADTVWVNYEMLEAVADAERALDSDAPLLFEGADSNLVWSDHHGAGSNPLEGAEVVIRQKLLQPRLAPVPMEGAAILAEPDGDGGLLIHLGTQNPSGARAVIASVLGVDPGRVHVTVPAMGGGFGAKGPVYVEHIAVAALAMRLGRPVAWTETRTENLINMVQGRAQIQYAELGATTAGRIVGLDVRVRIDAGAYPTVGASLGKYFIEMASGVYDIPKIEVVVESVVTNLTPMGPYRGAGRPEATQLMERMVDLLALELGMDPIEVRRINAIPAFELPRQTATAAVYDSGDYLRLLDMALDRSGWPELVAERQRRIDTGDRKQLGLGVSMYAETNIGVTPKQEFGAVRLNDDGTVTVRIGGSSHGQGHVTTFSQLVADQFCIDVERVEVLQSDTRLVPESLSGTFASRTLQLVGSSTWVSGDQVIGTARRLAAERLEASLTDMVIVPDVGIGVVGSPDTYVTWQDIAAIARHKGEKLEAEVMHDSPGPTYPFGAHVAVVEIDMDTGWARLVRHVAVDDCGTLVNPMIAMGQQHGGVVQGAGQALFEWFRFDEAGYPMTGNLTSYLIPAPSDVPMIETHRSTTPTSFNPIGAKGIGESGTLGSTPAIHSAVMDVLSRHGVKHLDMPLTPSRVWGALDAARREGR